MSATLDLNTQKTRKQTQKKPKGSSKAYKNIKSWRTFKTWKTKKQANTLKPWKINNTRVFTHMKERVSHVEKEDIKK